MCVSLGPLFSEMFFLPYFAKVFSNFPGTKYMLNFCTGQNIRNVKIHKVWKLFHKYGVKRSPLITALNSNENAECAIKMGFDTG